MIKTKLFTAKDVKDMPSSLALQPTPVPAETNREPVLILIIGSARGIDKIVHAL